MHKKEKLRNGFLSNFLCLLIFFFVSAHTEKDGRDGVNGNAVNLLNSILPGLFFEFLSLEEGGAQSAPPYRSRKVLKIFR